MSSYEKCKSSKIGLFRHKSCKLFNTPFCIFSSCFSNTVSKFIEIFVLFICKFDREAFFFHFNLKVNQITIDVVLSHQIIFRPNNNLISWKWYWFTLLFFNISCSQFIHRCRLKKLIQTRKAISRFILADQKARGTMSKQKKWTRNILSFFHLEWAIKTDKEWLVKFINKKVCPRVKKVRQGNEKPQQ